MSVEHNLHFSDTVRVFFIVVKGPAAEATDAPQP
jgi:hypothetical protein